MMTLKDALLSNIEKYGLSFSRREDEIVISIQSQYESDISAELDITPKTATLVIDGEEVSFDLTKAADDIQDDIYDQAISIAKQDGESLGLIACDLISDKEKIKCIESAHKKAIKESIEKPRNSINRIEGSIKSDLYDAIWSDIHASNHLSDSIEEVSCKSLPLLQMLLESVNEVAEFDMSPLELLEVYESYAFESFEKKETTALDHLLSSSIDINYVINKKSEYLYDNLVDLSDGMKNISQEDLTMLLVALSISAEEWNDFIKREIPDHINLILSQHYECLNSAPVISPEDLFELLDNSGQKGVLVVLTKSNEKDFISIDIEHSAVIDKPIVAMINPFDGTGSYIQSDSSISLPEGFIKDCYFDYRNDEINQTAKSILNINDNLNSFEVNNATEVDSSKNKSLNKLLNKLIDDGKIKLDENNSLIVNTESYLPSFGFKGSKIDIDSFELSKNRQRNNNNNYV